MVYDESRATSYDYAGENIATYTLTGNSEWYGATLIDELKYEYDACGRITKVFWRGYASDPFILQKEYRYDAKGQLVYELCVDLETSGYYMGDSPAGLGNAYAFRYTYDNAGNMTVKEKLVMTRNADGEWEETSIAERRCYTYGAPLADGSILGDALLGEAVVVNPQAGVTYTPTYDTLTYDAVGNPLTYHNAEGSYTFTWTNGRQLASVTKNGVTTTYTYNKDGIRTSKTVNGVRHDYILNGSTILAELWTENGISYGMYFTYDEKGMPFTMEYREGDSTALYYYLTDAFGKITGLMDESGTIVCRYAYDGYGNAEAKMTWSGGLGSTPNPFLYNGYYYDAETGFYYCNSRYYDPENGRFINPDEVIADVGGAIKGYNVYVYCFNDPVNSSDANGNWPRWITAIGIAVVTAVVPTTAIAAAACTTVYIAQSIHYDVRQALNTELPQNADQAKEMQWRSSDDEENPAPPARFHQYSSKNDSNVKFVSQDGHKEAIYDEKEQFVTDPRDVGTYNFCPADVSKFGHFMLDVLSWIIFGNSDEDPGPIINEVVELFEG